MNNLHISGAILICLLGISGCGQAVAGVSDVSEASDEIPSATQDIFAMDTYMTVTAYGTEAEKAVEAAAAEISRLEALFSAELEDSDIYRINHEKNVQVSDETMTVLSETKQLYSDTDGAFDICIYPIMQAWGFPSGNYTVPTNEQLTALLADADAGYVELNTDNNQVTLTHENTEIDLGGIAKGYTSARLMDIFEDYDLVSGMVNLGGNVQVYAPKPDGSDWRVAIQDPEHAENYIGVVAVSDAAVITSGGYERYFESDGVTYHHIIDPATGKPADSGLSSVTIVSSDGMLADGLSTSFYIMGREKADAYWEQHKEAFDMILIEDDGSISVTAGLTDSFSSEKTFEIID